MSSLRSLIEAEARPFLQGRNRRMTEAIDTVGPILDAVSARGDAALAEYAKRLDGHSGPFVVDRKKVAAAAGNISADLRHAMEFSKAKIEAFARLQMPKEFTVKLAPGHTVGQIVRPLDTVAAYVPGGRYPLPSTVLMTAVPATVAQVPNIWITTPRVSDETLAAAAIAGVINVALLGGAQAIAAFAFGTQTIPRADRIVGPGNIYVAAAKKLLAGEVGIDFVAGPTEVLVVANEGNAAWIAADMLAQAEHDTDAAALFVTSSRKLAEAVVGEVDRQLASLPTGEVAAQSIGANSAVIVTGSDQESMDLANWIAPEHLCLHDPALLPLVRHAGSVFIGEFSPEAAGDYATGPNHVLPTGGAARSTGGLSVSHFLKVITTQELTPMALIAIAPVATSLARSEGLEGHARSIEIRQQEAILNA